MTEMFYAEYLWYLLKKKVHNCKFNFQENATNAVDN